MGGAVKQTVRGKAMRLRELLGVIQRAGRRSKARRDDGEVDRGTARAIAHPRPRRAETRSRRRLLLLVARPSLSSVSVSPSQNHHHPKSGLEGEQLGSAPSQQVHQSRYHPPLAPIPGPLAMHTLTPGDVTKRAAWENLLSETTTAFGGVNFVINNAGATYASKPVLETTEADFDKVSDVNLKSIFHSVHVMVPALLETRKRGGPTAVVTVASTAGIMGRPGLTWYCGSKAAAISVTKNLAIEFGPDQIVSGAGLEMGGDSCEMARCVTAKRVSGCISICPQQLSRQTCRRAGRYILGLKCSAGGVSLEARRYRWLGVWKSSDQAAMKGGGRPAERPLLVVEALVGPRAAHALCTRILQFPLRQWTTASAEATDALSSNELTFFPLYFPPTHPPLHSWPKANPQRFNAVCPVFGNTGLKHMFVGQASEEQILKTIPLGRASEPEDIANSVVFLCSDEAAFLTGVALPVDGGRLA